MALPRITSFSIQGFRPLPGRIPRGLTLSRHGTFFLPTQKLRFQARPQWSTFRACSTSSRSDQSDKTSKQSKKRSKEKKKLSPEQEEALERERQARADVRKPFTRVFFQPFDELFESRESSVVAEGAGWILIAGLAVVGLVAFYSLFLYSLPGLGAQSVFNQAWAFVKDDPRVTTRLGGPLSAQLDVDASRYFRVLPSTEWKDKSGFLHKRIHFFVKGQKRLGRIEVECVFSPEASGMLGAWGQTKAVWRWKARGEPLLRWAYIDLYEIGSFHEVQGGTIQYRSESPKLAMAHPEQPWLISEKGHTIYPYFRLAGRPLHTNSAKNKFARMEMRRPSPEDSVQPPVGLTPLQSAGLSIVRRREAEVTQMLESEPMSPPEIDFENASKEPLYSQHVERDWFGLFKHPRSRL